MDNVWARYFSHFFFSSFLENDLSKVDKILGLNFFKARILCSMNCLQLSFIRVEEAVSWTHRFLTRKIWPRNRSWFMTNKSETECLQKFYVSSKWEKECLRKTSYLEQPSRHFCQHFMRSTTRQTLLIINLASQQKTTRLFPLRNGNNSNFWRFHLSHYAVVSKW